MHPWQNRTRTRATGKPLLGILGEAVGGMKMSVKIKRITLWRTEVENEPGVLARTLEPLAGAGWDLEVVMGYPETGDKAAIEIYPIAGKKAVAAAQAAGLTASSIPTLLVEGDNR